MAWMTELLELISANEATLSGLAAALAIAGVLAAGGYRVVGLLPRRPAREQPGPEATTPAISNTSREDRGRPDASPGSARPSVAVLPFRSLSSDEEKSYFADGLTEDLIAGLSQGRHLSVKSRSATAGLGDSTSDVRRLGQTLDVGYVVEGSVRSISDSIRISVQLIEAATGDTLWAERFDRPAEQLFEIQDAVIAGITSALGANITKAESARATALKPSSLSAWEAVQRASFYRGADGNSEEETNRSIEELRDAVRNEPDYAYAHSMLAWILHYRAINGLTDDPGADFAEAAPHLQKGLALASDDPFNLNICGGAFGYIGRWKRGEELCKRALAIDPNFADADFNLASIYTYSGRTDEAEAALDRVEARAPNGPMSRYYDWYRSLLRSVQGRHEEAERLQRATIDRAPSYTSPYLNLALTLAELGRIDEAREMIGRALAVNPRLTPDRVRILVESHPDPDQGQRRLEMLRELWPPQDGQD